MAAIEIDASSVAPSAASTEVDEGGVRGSPLPAFTDLTRKWEIDDVEPCRYQSSIFYTKQNPVYEKENPYFMNIPIDPSWVPKLKQTNVSYTRKVVSVTDIRGHPELFSLDRQGFQLGTLQTALAYDSFADTATIVSRFYEEVKVFLEKHTGAVEVLPFDFQVRRKDPTLPANSRGAPGKAQPFAAVHADQTANAAIRRLKYFHPEFAEKYAKGRFQIINVWKPLHGPVHSSPLAVCDYRTVKDEDLVPTDIIFPDYLGETYNFFPSAEHRWYYIDGQQADEAWMIKCFDSATTVNPEVAQFAPHVSFPYTKPGTIPGEVRPRRESVEVRTFVFYM